MRLGGAMSTVSLFGGVSPDVRAMLERSAVSRRFDPGESLFVQDGPAGELFLLKKGRVKVWRASEDGTALTLTLVGAGAPIGTLGAVDDRRNHATATAVTMVDAWVWQIDALRQMMVSSPALAANVLRTVTNYAEQLIQRLEEVGSIPVEQRIARTLLRLAARRYGDTVDHGCVLPLSRQDLAELTSTTLPTVSRVMSRWKNEHLIGGERGTVTLLDCEALGRIAERSA
jgi:CRP/FNR family transcriptional regulator, nitrogen oxide reductase regulator